MRAMIDTCVVIDLMQKREPFFRAAQGIFLAVADQKIEGYLSAKSIADIYYLMHRFFHEDGKTREKLEAIFELFLIADTTGEDCRRALFSQVHDYEDAVMAQSALRIGADCLVTRNTKDYLHAPLRVMDPEEFLAIIGEPCSP